MVDGLPVMFRRQGIKPLARGPCCSFMPQPDEKSSCQLVPNSVGDASACGSSERAAITPGSTLDTDRSRIVDLGREGDPFLQQLADHLLRPRRSSPATPRLVIGMSILNAVSIELNGTGTGRGTALAHRRLSP